jgi:hypothetical protein
MRISCRILIRESQEIDCCGDNNADGRRIWKYIYIKVIGYDSVYWLLLTQDGMKWQAGEQDSEPLGLTNCRKFSDQLHDLAFQQGLCCIACGCKLFYAEVSCYGCEVTHYQF